ncbi:MAG: hypothetical protein JOZ41_09650, partial [Chloroflexi bacterium]|nr:hypothetical protein [Chloroflexota bacterium]
LSFVPHSEQLRLPMDLRLTRYGPGDVVHLDVPPAATQGPDVYDDFLLAVDGERAPAVSGREVADMFRIIERVYAAAGTLPMDAGQRPTVDQHENGGLSDD